MQHRIACSTHQHGLGRLKTLVAAIALIGFTSAHAGMTDINVESTTVKTDTLAAYIHAPAFAKSTYDADLGREPGMMTATAYSYQIMLSALRGAKANDSKDADIFAQSSSAHFGGATYFIGLRDGDRLDSGGFMAMTGKFELSKASAAILGIGDDSKTGTHLATAITGDHDGTFLKHEPGAGSFAVTYVGSDHRSGAATFAKVKDSGWGTASAAGRLLSAAAKGFDIAGLAAPFAQKGLAKGHDMLASFHPGVMGAAANGHSMVLAA